MEIRIFPYFFSLFLFLPFTSFSQEAVDFYISNTGNDTLPGTSVQLAKRTIAGSAPLLKNFSTANGIVKVGLKSGDIFEESLVTTYPIELTTYENSHQNDFAILNGSTGNVVMPKSLTNCSACAAASTPASFLLILRYPFGGGWLRFANVSAI